MIRTLKYTLFFTAFLLRALTAKAQNTCLCEEGEKLKLQIISYADRGLADSAFIIYEKIKRQESNACLLLYYHGTSQLYMQKQDWANARQALTKAEKIIDKANCDPFFASKHYSITGLYFLNTNQPDSSAWAYLKAAEAAEKTNNKYALARAYGDVGFTMSQIGDFLKSIEYNKKSVSIASSLTNKQGMQLLAIKTAHLADAYKSVFDNTGNRKYLDSCGLTARQAIIAAKNGQDLNGVLEAYNILSRYHFIVNDFKQSGSYSDSIIVAHIQGFTNRFTSLAWFNKAEIAQKKEEWAKAASFADSAQVYAAMFNPQLEIASLELQYKLYKKQNNTGKALTAFERMTLLKDSLLGFEKNKIITELEKKYTQAKNERTIKELAQQKQIYLLFGIAGLLVAVVIGFYFRQQSLKHKQKILETEQRLNRARINPHFFFNALTAMQRFAMKENDGKTLAYNLSKFSTIMRETLENSYKEYVTIKQEVEFLKEYMEIQKMRFPQMFSYSLMIDGEMEPTDVMIPSMIIQPFIENSIEHGFADIDYPGVVRVDFKQTNKTIAIEIQDNGRGLSLPESKTNEHISRASQIIKDRIYLLNIKLKTKADFSIHNNQGDKGVIVKIHLPIIYKNENTAN
jgi:tetratricopeptide (TPR) repeat protein